MQYISTDEQVANILTKSLGRGKFVFFRDELGVVKNNFLGKREVKICTLEVVPLSDFALVTRKGEIK